MNREILFRGKRTDNGDWVEGSFVDKGNGAYIICKKVVGCMIDYEEYEVEKETVCQYINFTGHNGVKLFENDIVEHDSVTDYTKGVISYDSYEGRYYVDDINLGVVTFYGECWEWLDVIGNIFDNPDLLKE